MWICFLSFSRPLSCSRSTPSHAFPHLMPSPSSAIPLHFPQIPSVSFTCLACSLRSLFHVPFQPRLLEHQLQTQKRSYDSEVEGLRGELQSVKEENNRQQQLLAQNLQLPPEARIEASLQHEITRLTNENLVRCNRNSEQTKEKKFTLSKSRQHHFLWFPSNPCFIQIFKLTFYVRPNICPLRSP